MSRLFNNAEAAGTIRRSMVAVSLDNCFRVYNSTVVLNCQEGFYTEVQT
jgi:DNA-binding cell septation regulator SpoVG